MTDEHRRSEDLEHYAGGEIQTRHGIINRWLLGLYAVLFLWSIWYVVGPFEGWRPRFEFWGGEGWGPACRARAQSKGWKGSKSLG